MKETLTTSDTALKHQSEDILCRLNFLLKGLKLCEPITGNLLIRIIDKLNINSNTVLR